MIKNQSFKSSLLILFFVTHCVSPSPKLVSDSSILSQQSATEVLKLSNDIPVVLRYVPDSDIVNIKVGFRVGTKDNPVGSKTLGLWSFSSLDLGSKNFPKEKLNALVEKYALSLDCGQEVDFSNCTLDTLNDYWNESLPALADIIKFPSFDPGDMEVVKQKLLAKFESIPNDPDSYSNELVNQCFYSKNHPYYLSYKQALSELNQLKSASLKEYHQKQLNSANMAIVVVSSLPKEKVMADLEKHFGSITKGTIKVEVPMDPQFDPKCTLVFENRDIPTAYIMAKFSSPSMTATDSVAARLMFNIFSEILDEEVRTKRSLSYGTYAYTRQYQIGLGIIASTTPNPEATLATIQDVITQMKKTALTQSELDEYKKEFATMYYLRQETHGSLAAKLLETYLYFNNLDAFYTLPRQLDSITTKDIKEVANKYLKNMRLGILYQQSKFKAEWATKFVEGHKIN